MKMRNQQPKNEEAPGAVTPRASDTQNQLFTEGNCKMNNSTQEQSSQLPVIAGHEINTDEHGRFNLNAIHRASGEGEHKRPSKWLATAPAQELVDHLEVKSPSEGFKNIESRKGRGGGTYAHELLAVSYAGWMSPSFQLDVNQAFLDYRMGKLQHAETKPAYEALPNPLTPAHQRGIQKAVGRRCFNFPEPARPKAYKRIYSHLKDRFGVAKYDQIPDERYTEALGAVESYSFNGDFLEAEALPETKQVKVLDLDAWLDMNFYIKHRQMDSRRVLITPQSLIDSEYRSPTLRLVKEMEAEGHNLDACRLEVLSLRHHLSSCISKIEQMMGVAQGIHGQGVSFTRPH